MKKLLLPASLVLLIVSACCTPKNGADNATQSENSKVNAPSDNKEAPPHNAPNQAEIDSLKIERAKEKQGDE